MNLSRSILFISLLLSAACGKVSQPRAKAGLPLTTSQTENAELMTSKGTLSQKGVFIAQLDWLSGPYAEQYSKARVTILNSKNLIPQSVTDVQFQPFMPAMGHGTMTKDQKIAPEGSANHVFNVEGIYFIMGGPWEVRLTATVDEVKDTALITVQVP